VDAEPVAWKVRSIVPIGLMIVSLAAMNPALADSGSSVAAPNASPTASASWLPSAYYAGYEQTSDSQDLGEVSAVWNVPPKPEPVPKHWTDIATWIGIGGKDLSLMQEGTTWTSVNGGTPKLTFWYDELNGKSPEDSGFCCTAVDMPWASGSSVKDLAGGDQVAALLAELSSTSWQVVMDVYNGKTLVAHADFFLTTKFPIGDSRALVEVERGTYRSSKGVVTYYNLASTPPVIFSNAYVSDEATGESVPMASKDPGLSLFREYMTTSNLTKPGSTDDPLVRNFVSWSRTSSDFEPRLKLRN
jgi:Peptidase A4 family